MKKLTKTVLLVLMSLMLLFISATAFAKEETQKTSYVYRVYNSKSSEHLYTIFRSEVNSLVKGGGWTEEGIGWGSPVTGNPVYRIYNPQLGEHLYSTDPNEVETLCAQHGWMKDFNGNPLFYSGGNLSVFRLYNPQNGRHHLTTDEYEANVLSGQGWQNEGTKLQCLSGFNPYFSTTAVSDRINSLRNDYPEGKPWTNDDHYVSTALKTEGWGCHAFALICSDTAFGDWKGRTHHDASDIRVGDLLRIASSDGTPDNHSIIVTNIKGDILTITEGNWNQSIHWDRKVNVNDLNIAYIITRYPA